MAIFGSAYFLRTRQASKGTALVALLLGASYQLWATMAHKARARQAV
jgi:hypothetical protein